MNQVFDHAPFYIIKIFKILKSITGYRRKERALRKIYKLPIQMYFPLKKFSLEHILHILDL